MYIQLNPCRQSNQNVGQNMEIKLRFVWKIFQNISIIKNKGGI